MIIGTNFKLSSAKFLDDRQLCKDYNTLITNAEGIIYPPGFEVFCEYENKYYQYISDTNGGYIWEERKSGVSDGTSASIKDDTISEEYTWSSAHIDSMRVDLEALIIQANDYVDEIDERMLYIEGKFQWFEYFDGSYESLTDKPTIPTKLSELEDDLDISESLLSLEENKVEKEDGKTLIDIEELNRLSVIENYDDTEIENRLLTVESSSHSHDNSYILDTITESMINQWNSSGSDNYNYLINKPIERAGDDIDLAISINDLNNKGIYIINGLICKKQLINELCLIEKDDENTIVNIIMLNSMKKITIGVTDISEEWELLSEENYGIDKNNGKITDTLTIGEDNIILDKEGNGWYGGKLSQEGTPTEDKDLVTKGYVDNKFATNERIDAIDKANERRDVIIEALANGRKRTVETVGNDVDLIFSTEKDNVWIDKIEGETLVNVCDQEESVAITKSYTVEGTNHIPFEGEYDGKARPVIYGNTLVNHNAEYDRELITTNEIYQEGYEFLGIEGVEGSEVRLSVDGHTAINLSTKKEDVLCKSFDGVSGNEINLVTEENSVSDLVVQGNTMVNLCNLDSVVNTYGYVRDNEILSITSTSSNTYHIYYIGGKELFKVSTIYTIIVDVYENTITDGVLRISSFSGYTDDQCDIFNAEEAALNNITINNGETGRFIFVRTTASDFSQTNVALRTMFSNPNLIEGQKASYSIMIFEGDLTQTPELIPTEYVEGLQSTFEDKLIPYSIYDGTQLTSVTETQYQLPLTVETNTTYTVVTTMNTTKYQYAIYSTDGLSEYFSYDNTISVGTFTSDTTDIYFKVRMNPSYEGDDYYFTLSDVQDTFLIVEGDWTSRLELLTDEYFGKYKVDMSSHGKNLLDINNHLTISSFSNYELLENGIHFYSTGYTYRYFNYRIKVKKNTDYTVSLNAIGTGTMVCEIYDLDNKWIKTMTDNIYKTVGYFNSDDYEELNLRFFGTHKNETECDIVVTNIQLEEGTQTTEYEPYYGGSTKTVYLNSPLLDGDELLTKDGKLYHYHKMGRVVLDGSEDWVNFTNTSIHINVLRFYTTNITCKSISSILCNRFSYLITTNQDIEGMVVGADGFIYINILRSKLSTTDLAGFKQWLSENPTTVVYELAEPYYELISPIDDMRFNIASTSTIEYQSNVPMANTQFLPYINNLPLLESSTEYRVVFDCDVEGLELMVSLGGTSQTITSQSHNELSFITPSLQTDNKLIIDGYGVANIDNVLITSGSMEYEYFEGLQSGFEEKELEEFGIEVDFATMSYTRLNKTDDDFTNVYPYNSMKKCNTKDGVVLCYEDEEGFIEDGTNGDVMVEIPKFYYKVVPITTEQNSSGEGKQLVKAQWWIRGSHKEGYKIHPAFVRNGITLNHIYISAYEGSLYDTSENTYILDDSQVADFSTDMLSSIKGAKPISGLTQNLTITNAELLCTNKGEGYLQYDFTMASMLQLLMLVEYCTFDIQSVLGNGVVNITDDSASNLSVNTGSDSCISYHGIENPYGNIWKFVSGLNIYNYSNPKAYWSNNDKTVNTSDNHNEIGFNLCTSNGYISRIGYDENNDFVFLPTKVDSTYANSTVKDYYYQNTSSSSWTIARLGGRWNSGSGAGAFCWNVYDGSSTRSRNFGCRLAFFSDEDIKHSCLATIRVVNPNAPIFGKGGKI